MEWSDHRYWARKAGIADGVSAYVDRVVDMTEEDQLPADFTQTIPDLASQVCEDAAAQTGNSGLPLVVATYIITGHDPSRVKATKGKLAAAVMTRFLEEKGSEYLRAWYLHHHLDYLAEHKDTAKDIKQLLDDFETEYPQIYSSETVNFLDSHADELTAALDCHSCPT